MVKSLLILILSIFAVSNAFAQDSTLNMYSVGLHFDTAISGGKYTAERLVQMGLEAGLDAVVFCDHDRMEVEYGIFPLRNLIKKRVAEPSLASYGFDNYVGMMDSLAVKYPDITIIHGTETGPCYYWTGSPLSKNLTLNNWHQHMMVIGMETGEDYAGIPSTSARILSGKPDNIIYDYIAGALLILSLAATRFSVKVRVNFAGQKMLARKRPFKFTGIFIALLCLAYLINDYPYKKWVYSPYDGDSNPAASQTVIDYANSRNALVYYSHPEGEYKGNMSGLEIATESYNGLLLSTTDYTGFAVFAEGWRQAGKPSGEWDRVLYQYCSGEREKPVWAVGELDFEGDLPAEFLKETNTYVWAKDRSKEAILQALREGKCWCSQIWGPNFIFLDEWNISEPMGSKAMSGEILAAASEVNLRFSMEVTDGEKYGFEAMIIRNGRQLATVAFDESTEIDFPDDPPQGKSFYRLWVLYRGVPILAANPIFVVKQ